MKQQRRKVTSSIRVLQFIVLGIGLILIGRLIQLQIVDFDTYNPISRENSVRQTYVHPARGLIFDRNGRLLVDNEPIYTINVTPSSYDRKKNSLLVSLLGTSEQDLQDRLKQAQQFSWHRTSRLYTEVDFKTFSLIQENIWRLPGISHQIESKRFYPTQAVGSHIFGYLREISKDEYQSSDRYRLGDKAGKSGLELVYENYLRGQLGVSYMRINALGQELGPFENGRMDEHPKEGFDVLTTIDTDLQVLAEKLMVNKLGAVVAMDPRDGAILALVSSPTYDISKLAGKLDLDYWRSVNADSTTPLFNRAITSQQPPGSTFKPLMALMGLKLGLITEKTKVYCSGKFVKGREYKCTTTHGDMTLEQAIQNSCNTYFFSLMNRLAMQGELNKWHRMAIEAGLGQRTNIDLPNETNGILPDSAYMNRFFGPNMWGIGDLINLGVGQGIVSASPLQMAVVTSTIANGGYKVQPHLVKAVRSPDNQLQPTNPAKTKASWIEPGHLELVQRGMRKAIQEGSSRGYTNVRFTEVAGKTGTAQNPHGRDHAWFISYAPFDNPELVVVALVENAGFGASSAAPISSLLMEQYFTGQIRRQWVVERMLNFVPKDPD